MTTGSITPKRNIGGIVADITVEERHADELAITSHPVEQGAAITDHAFKQPNVVDIRVGFTNSGAAAGGDEGYVRRMYDKLLALQVGRELLDVVTGKRAYSDMLIRSLRLATNEQTEFSAFIEVSLQQVIIAQTSVTTLPDASKQAEPQQTTTVIDAGTKQPVLAQPSPASISTPGGS